MIKKQVAMFGLDLIIGKEQIRQNHSPNLRIGGV